MVTSVKEAGIVPLGLPYHCACHAPGTTIRPGFTVTLFSEASLTSG